MTLDPRRSYEAITLDDSARLGRTWCPLRSTFFAGNRRSGAVVEPVGHDGVAGPRVADRCGRGLAGVCRRCAPLIRPRSSANLPTPELHNPPLRTKSPAAMGGPVVHRLWRYNGSRRPGLRGEHSPVVFSCFSLPKQPK